MQGGPGALAARGADPSPPPVCNEENPCEGMSRHATFENFGMAFLTLFRVSTGDNWNGIMKVPVVGSGQGLRVASESSMSVDLAHRTQGAPHCTGGELGAQRSTGPCPGPRSPVSGTEARRAVLPCDGPVRRLCPGLCGAWAQPFSAPSVPAEASWPEDRAEALPRPLGWGQAAVALPSPSN